METNTIIVSVRNVTIRYSNTEPSNQFIGKGNSIQEIAILNMKKPNSPKMADITIFLSLFARCNHVPPFTFQYKVECLVIFCHYSSPFHCMLSKTFFSIS